MLSGELKDVSDGGNRHFGYLLPHTYSRVDALPVAEQRAHLDLVSLILLLQSWREYVFHYSEEHLGGTQIIVDCHCGGEFVRFVYKSKVKVSPIVAQCHDVDCLSEEKYRRVYPHFNFILI